MELRKSVDLLRARAAHFCELADRATDPDVAETLRQTAREIDAAIAIVTEQDN
jgi:hypothetical protein